MPRCVLTTSHLYGYCSILDNEWPNKLSAFARFGQFSKHISPMFFDDERDLAQESVLTNWTRGVSISSVFHCWAEHIKKEKEVAFLSQCNSDEKYASIHIGGSDVYEGGEGMMSLQLACKNLAKVSGKTPINTASPTTGATKRPNEFNTSP
jgi:hypothetical protein